MLLTFQDIQRCNQSVTTENKKIDKENNNRRYNSSEEKQFTLGACVGFFSLWKPSIEPRQIGLPPEISCMIGEKLSRDDARNIALTCKKANTAGKENRELYIEEHGKTYEEKSHQKYTGYML